ncbi:MAG TPA: hypothetical protein VGM11_05015 [Acidobacteriaceae bacterium]
MIRLIFAYHSSMDPLALGRMDDFAGTIGLRSELALRALQFAAANKLTCERTDGVTPAVIFNRDASGRHGNFHPLADQAICSNPAWAKRLNKVHTASKRVRARADWRWMELDSANSSDALLMNIFCHPEVPGRPAVRALLGLASDAEPHFGVKPRTPMLGNRYDTTEIDMRIGDVLIEAKLTESDFQTAKPNLILRYRDLEQVFDFAELPVRNEKVIGYQLIRGTLAAHASGCSFCVCCDARRHDLIEIWYRIIRAVQPFDLRCRMKLLTWQELAAAVSHDLATFLAIKYGVFPA